MNPLLVDGPSSGCHARAILVDLEPEAVDRVRNNPGLRGMFSADNMININEGTGGYSTRAKYTIGKEVSSPVQESIRRMMEACDSVGGFIIYTSPMGGTGSGLSSLIPDIIWRMQSKFTLIGCDLVDGPNMSNSCVAPYNYVLASSDHIERYSLHILQTNESLYQRLRDNFGVESPDYRQANKLIAD